jgi:hypothetical protein
MSAIHNVPSQYSIVVICYWILLVGGFVAPVASHEKIRPWAIEAPSPHEVAQQASSTATVATVQVVQLSEQHPSKAAELNFQGQFYHDAETIPITEVSTHRLFSFFQNPVNRNLVLKGGGNPTEYIPATQDICETWGAQSRIVKSAPPTIAAKDDDDDTTSVLAIYSTVPLLPGLSIRAVSYTGCKLLAHPQTSLPMYEFTLIYETYSAVGTKPMVWIYNQLTGGGAGVGGNTQQHRAVEEEAPSTCHTHALSRITMEPDAESGMFRLCYFGMVQVSCSIPRRLLKILPFSQRKIEAKVSKAIVKQLKREGLQSIEKFRTALEIWAKR